LGEGLTTPNGVNVSLLRNIYRQNLGPGLIIWHDVSNERGTGGLRMRRIFGPKRNKVTGE
jgi:hypothetical protein